MKKSRVSYYFGDEGKLIVLRRYVEEAHMYMGNKKTAKTIDSHALMLTDAFAFSTSQAAQVER